jgi:hypothetical protein
MVRSSDVSHCAAQSQHDLGRACTRLSAFRGPDLAPSPAGIDKEYMKLYIHGFIKDLSTTYLYKFLKGSMVVGLGRARWTRRKPWTSEHELRPCPGRVSRPSPGAKARPGPAQASTVACCSDGGSQAIIAGRQWAARGTDGWLPMAGCRPG